MADDDIVRVKLVWDDAYEFPITVANQMSITFLREGEFVLTLGQVAPPILAGSDEEKSEQAREIDALRIRPVARFGLTRQSVAEFADALERNLKRHDTLFAEAKDE